MVEEEKMKDISVWEKTRARALTTPNQASTKEEGSALLRLPPILRLGSILGS
jgi:hypothetical protein